MNLLQSLIAFIIVNACAFALESDHTWMYPSIT